MKHNIIAWFFLVLLVLAGVAAVSAWMAVPALLQFDLRLPGADGRPAGEGALSPSAEGPDGGRLEVFDAAVSNIAGGAWPRFRGADFAGISKENIDLASTWPPAGPKVLWSVELGEGYAGAAVLNGRVYVLDYDMQKKADSLRCFLLGDGREIWRYSYPVHVKRNHGMSRTVPAVTDKYVVAIGPKCHVVCLDAVGGRYLWGIDLVSRWGTKVPLWYAGQCPLIDNSRAIIATGGRALMIAVDCADGSVVWQSPNPDGWEMTHSSIVPAVFAGKRFYIYCGSGGVAGVCADDGQILWSTDAWKMRTNVPSPVIAGDGLIFLSAGYNQGSMMLKLQTRDDRIVPEVLFRLEASVFGADQQTPIFSDGFIYGVRPDQQFVCLGTDGKIVWTSGPQYKFGLGPFTMAGDIMYIINDSGQLTMAAVSPSGFVPLSQAKILDGMESWGPIAIASGRLIARDLTKMVCVEIAASKTD